MKELLIFALCLSAVYCARLPVVPGKPVYPIHKPVVQKPQNIQQVSVVPGHVHDEHHQNHAAIISQDSDVNPDGSFHNVWKSDNGIDVMEAGTVDFGRNEQPSLRVEGRVTYLDEEGNPITLTYTADESGFHPQGAHLPTPPPIPIAILRGLEWIAKHPEEDKSGKVIANTKYDTPIVEDA